ncbi:MAG: hypothetical protein HC850_07910 [Rhodomicrobium sp.]|nr:hypothetical protein [Rhodomicrobium sp.]
MSDFDEQVYHLKDALWHQRRKTYGDEEIERRRRLDRLQIPEPKSPEGAELFVIFSCGIAVTAIGLLVFL